MNTIREHAKFLSLQVPDKGKSTYTKHFDAGIMNDNLRQLLEDLEEYLDNRADAIFEDNKYFPNEAMKLLTRVQEIKKKLNEKTGSIFY